MSRDAIVRTVEVAADPAAAFRIFTEEIDAWYQRGPHSWNDPRRAVGIRFEAGVGGRWLEVWDAASGEGFEIGRILAWEPGRRLLLSYRSVHLPADPLTEIEVRFDPMAGGTRVRLEHRGWDRLPPAVGEKWAGRAWIALVGWFRDYVARRKENSMTTTAGSPPANPNTVTPYLCCKGAAHALDFYAKVFGAAELTRWTDPSGKIGHAEIVIGNSTIMLADEAPELDVRSPQSLGGTPVSLHLYVADVDAVARAAVDSGAVLLRPVADQAYGDRNCKLADPFGHVWMVSTRKEEVGEEELKKRVGAAYDVSGPQTR